MITLGILGAGYIGCLHASILLDKFPDVAVKFIYDKYESKARQFGEKHNISVCRNAEKILTDKNVDAVLICTPTDLHCTYTLEALKNNKHVFCEKPLAPSLEDAEKMVRAADKNKQCRTMTGHVLRFWPAYAKVKEIAAGGALGKPVNAEFFRLLTFPGWTDGWNRSEKSNGGAHISTNLEYGNGVKGTVQAGWSFQKEFPFTAGYRIFFEKGTLERDFRGGKILEQREKESPYIPCYTDTEIKKIDIKSDDAFYLQMRYFIDSLAQNREITNATFAQGKEALEIVRESILSAQSGEVRTV